MASYADDIRRIAKQKGLKGGIGDLQPRDPIPGTVTPFDASLFAQANDSTNPSNKTPEATDGKNPNTFNKGDGSGGDGTSGGSRDTNGPQDIEDILDDKAGPTSPDSNISGIFSGGMLNKITGLVDCNNGKCAIFNLDGEYIPPDGWESPDIGPVLPDYEPGYYWTYFQSGIVAQTAPQVVEKYISNHNSNPNRDSDWSESLSRYTIPGAEYISNIHYVDLSTGAEGGFSIYVFKRDCSTSPDPVGCVPTEPRETQWPTDNCYQLAFQDGKVVSHQSDPNAPDWAQNGSKSAATLCTQSGRKVKISPASAGGTIVREVNNLGAAIGIVRVYNSDGTLRGAGDAAWIDSQKPR